MTRVLVFTADIGSGHDVPARVLADGLREREPACDVAIVDFVRAAGGLVRLVVRSGAERVLGTMPWLFDAQYWLIARFAPTRRLGSRLLRLLAARGVLREVAARRPDVVVSTYPGATEVLGVLRASGRLDVPVVSAITDLAALRYWSHRGCDVHLVIHPESAAEVRAIAGDDATVTAVRGLNAAAFEAPREQAAARAELGLPQGAPAIVVSGGGWAVGDLAGAIAAGLAARPDAHVVALCGTSEGVRARLTARFAAEPRVHVLGFTDRMSDVLAAADVLVHSTAGLTVLEALVRGTRVVSYGWGVGHIRLNNRAYLAHGLAAVARDRSELGAELERALASPLGPDLDYGRRPAAADLVLAVSGR